MILTLPASASLASADAFAQALDVAKGARSVAQTGFTRFEVIEDPPLDAATEAAIRAVADAHGATIEGASPPKALAHGAKSATLPDLLAFDPERAHPRLHRVDTVGRFGLLKQEAWYRAADLDFGLTTTPKAGATPVYAIDYPSWTYGLLPGSTATRGILARGPRTIRLYAEDGTAAREVTDANPKRYSYADGVNAGNRRRANVVDFRATGIVLTALLIAFPNEDPGAKAATLLGVLDGAIRVYRATGEALAAALADPALRDPVTGAAPWLDTPINVPGLGDVPAIVLLLAEVAEPADGVVVP